jgi:MFS family permease
MRGTAMAVYFMAMYMCGASFGPLLTGRLSDRMAQRGRRGRRGWNDETYRAIGLQQAMFIIPVLSLLLGLVLYCGSRTISRICGKGGALPSPTYAG